MRFNFVSSYYYIPNFLTQLLQMPPISTPWEYQGAKKECFGKKRVDNGLTLQAPGKVYYNNF